MTGRADVSAPHAKPHGATFRYLERGAIEVHEVDRSCPEVTHPLAFPLGLGGGEQTYTSGDHDESGELEATETFAEEQERAERGERGEL